MSTWMVRVTVAAVVGAALALSPAALAKDGVRVAGKCSKASTSKLMREPRSSSRSSRIGPASAGVSSCSGTARGSRAAPR